MFRVAKVFRKKMNINVEHCFIFLNKKWFLFFLILFTLNVRSEAQSIKQQEIVRIDSEYVIDEFPTTFATNFALRPEDRKDLLTEFYWDFGYLSVQIAEISPDEFEVKTGCRFNAELKIEDEIHLQWYSAKWLQEQIDQSLDPYIANGFYFASANVASFIPDKKTCTVAIQVNVEKGEKIYAQSVRLQGSDLQNQNYIQRVVGMSDSTLITPNRLKKMRATLRETRFFEEIENPNIVKTADGFTVVIPVVDRSLNRFDGILGYVPDASGVGQIVGDIDLSLWNVIQPGNAFQIGYERLRPETSRLDVQMTQHYIRSIPIGVTGRFGFFQNDTTYQQRNIELESYYSMGNGMRITANLGQSTSTASVSDAQRIEPDGSKRFAEFGIEWSTVNKFEVPTSGLYLKIGVGTVRKSIEDAGLLTITQNYIESTFQHFISLGKQSVLASSVNSFYVLSEVFTDSDLYRFGGATSLRGFSEEQFQASRVLWGDVEYRFLTDASSYLFVFGAAGTYHRPILFSETDVSFKTTEYLHSFGFGLSYNIRIGRIKFTYALSPAESLGNGKVHVGIVTRL